MDLSSNFSDYLLLALVSSRTLFITKLTFRFLKSKPSQVGVVIVIFNFPRGDNNVITEVIQKRVFPESKSIFCGIAIKWVNSHGYSYV